MMKFRLIAAAGIAGVLTLLSSGTAHATYPDPPITITIDDADIIGGTTFSFIVKSGTVDCDWTVTYADGRAPGVAAVQTGSGTSIEGSYKTKVVSSVFRSPLKVVCSYDAELVEPTEGSSGVEAVTTRTAGASATVTLRPLGSDDTSALPDTGGSNLSLILLAGGLVLVGGGVTYMARRRSSNH